jgi:hypothetical protein
MRESSNLKRVIQGPLPLVAKNLATCIHKQPLKKAGEKCFAVKI